MAQGLVLNVLLFVPAVRFPSQWVHLFGVSCLSFFVTPALGNYSWGGRNGQNGFSRVWISMWCRDGQKCDSGPARLVKMVLSPLRKRYILLDWPFHTNIRKLQKEITFWVPRERRKTTKVRLSRLHVPFVVHIRKKTHLGLTELIQNVSIGYKIPSKALPVASIRYLKLSLWQLWSQTLYERMHLYTTNRSSKCMVYHTYFSR